MLSLQRNRNRLGRLSGSWLCLVSGMAACPAHAEVSPGEGVAVERPSPTAPAASANRAAGRQASETIYVLGTPNQHEMLVPKHSSSANKVDMSLLDTASSVSVITRAQLDMLNLRNLNEALRYTAGATSETSNGTSPRQDTVIIRGFLDRSGANEFVDNLRLFNGIWYASQQIDTYLLERIDVLKGPPSVLYGQSNPGGVIALSTKKPGDTPVHSLSVEGGTYGYVRGTGDYSGRIDSAGVWTYRLAATAMTSGSQDRFTRSERYAVLPSLRFHPNDRLDMVVSAFWQHDPKGGTYHLLPLRGTILDNPNGPLSAHLYTGDLNLERYNRTQTGIGTQLRYRFAKDWSLRSFVRYANIGSDFAEVASDGMLNADNRTVRRYTYVTEEHYDTVSLEQHLVGRVRTGPVSHQLLLGGSWQNVRDSGNYYAGSAPSLDVYRPVYNQTIPRPNLRNDLGLSTNQEGIFGQNVMKLGDLHAQLGLRHDWSDINRRDKIGRGSFAQHDEATTWRGSLLYEFAGSLSPYFNYAESFQPTNALGFDGMPFKPTRGRQYEVGVKYQPGRINAFFTLALYDLKQRNALVPDPVHIGFNTQAGGIRSRGIEFEAHADLTRELNLIAAYAYQDVGYTAGSGVLAGKRPVGVPRQTLSLWAHYTLANGPMQGLGAGLGVRYVSNTSADTTYGYVAPAYTLMDAQAQYRIDRLVPALKGLVFQVTAQNLLNQRYFSGCFASAIGCWAGATRNVIGRGTYSW